MNIGLGDGLVSSDKKLLAEPMLTQSHVAIWRQQATMSNDETYWTVNRPALPLCI